jgi:hypothetical protein
MYYNGKAILVQGWLTVSESMSKCGYGLTFQGNGHLLLASIFSGFSLGRQSRQFQYICRYLALFAPGENVGFVPSVPLLIICSFYNMSSPLQNDDEK